jgi:DNA (cytosine-5)-methyltransferase 1
VKIGSLFSGYGGLTLAVEEVFGATTAWHAEIEAAPAKVLDAHWPGVPNLGDITTVDWAAVEPVDIIEGGSPCQDVSAAGKRAGMRAGTRSGLWASMCDAIQIIRPRIVVWENVRGVLSAEADSALEPCAGCLGDGDDGPVLRALGRVLGDLADLGYDARWHGLRAADVGAPHGRFRVFVVATDARREHGQRWQDALTGGHRLQGSSDRPELSPAAPADAAHLGHERHWRARDGRAGFADGRKPATDADDHSARDGSEPGHATGSQSEPAQHGAATPDAASERWTRRIEPRPELVNNGQESAHARQEWGAYEPAIRRWESVLGRVAPAPTELAPRGGQRLSPRFVEWMMGLPAGWVTDVPGITRNEQLKMLGNGVVPQQAAAALRAMLDAQERAA